MVFFTCNACGESLKKSQVDKHVSVCRACQVLSCIDCGKDFWGDDYKSHVKCISEDQKYGGKGYEAKANKGVIKQQQWIQIIQEAINKPDINPKLKDVLSQVTSYENVPRKKAKFQNWMKNSLRIFNCDLQDQVWEIFSAAISSQATNQQQPKAKSATETSKEPCHPPHSHTMQEVEEQVKERKKNKRERKEERQKKNKKKQTEYNSKEEEKNGEIASAERQKKKRKREAEQHVEDKKTNKLKKHKREEPEEEQHQSSFESLTSPGGPSLEDQQEDSNSNGKFNWKGTIKAILQQSPPEGLTIKRLRKKVLAAYYSFCKDGNYKSEEQLFSLFNKKLNNPKFKILKDKVRLVK
ncbi:cell growth-regulating nucleolar protein isoform X1 [Electrophorus electricus]|uniref:cell growth-regulating nucleolar protein isoform X1 n=1 Tax=Electrophorus electricus TaxID=8005 RepID=UPI000F09F6C3|nr:cell growth-regulating nucleolar protein isoform X1 [Electrophorus electricus]